MTTATPELHSADELDILDRHAQAVEGEFLVKIALGITATTPEEIPARISIPVAVFEEKKDMTRREAIRAGLTDTELDIHDSVVVGKLVSLLQKITQYI